MESEAVTEKPQPTAHQLAVAVCLAFVDNKPALPRRWTRGISTVKEMPCSIVYRRSIEGTNDISLVVTADPPRFAVDYGRSAQMMTDDLMDMITVQAAASLDREIIRKNLGLDAEQE